MERRVSQHLPPASWESFVSNIESRVVVKTRIARAFTRAGPVSGVQMLAIWSVASAQTPLRAWMYTFGTVASGATEMRQCGSGATGCRRHLHWLDHWQ